jgi:hypothetical protein
VFASQALESCQNAAVSDQVTQNSFKQTSSDTDDNFEDYANSQEFFDVSLL